MYVIYHKETTVLHANPNTRTDAWETKSAAKSERTRRGLDIDIWLIAGRIEFKDRIEQTEVVYSIHDLKKERPITQGVNTPRCCDPSSELYWSM